MSSCQDRGSWLHTVALCFACYVSSCQDRGSWLHTVALGLACCVSSCQDRGSWLHTVALCLACCVSSCKASGFWLHTVALCLECCVSSVYSHTCYAYSQGFLPCLFLPFQSVDLHFSRNLSRFLQCWLWLTHGSCVGLQNKIGHPARCRFPCWVPAEYKLAKITWLVVWWLVKRITWRQGEICVQPWCNSLWLTVCFVWLVCI